MIYVSVEQLIDKIRRNDLKFARIYDGILTGIRTDIPYFDEFDMSSPEDLIASIQQFCKTYAGIYSIVMRRSNGGNIGGSTLVKVNLSPSGSAPISQAPILQGSQKSEEQLRQSILKDLKSEMLEQSIQSREAALIAEKQKLEFAGGKLMFILENWAMAKLTGKSQAAFAKNLQGTPPEINEANLEAAFKSLAQTLGIETIIKLAAKLKPGDPIISIVKNYANL